MYARMAPSTLPELAEDPGMGPVAPLAGRRRAGGFRKLFNPWVLPQPFTTKQVLVPTDLMSGDGPGTAPSFLPTWQRRSRPSERRAPEPAPREAQPVRFPPGLQAPAPSKKSAVVKTPNQEKPSRASK